MLVQQKQPKRREILFFFFFFCNMLGFIFRVRWLLWTRVFIYQVTSK